MNRRIILTSIAAVAALIVCFDVAVAHDGDLRIALIGKGGSGTARSRVRGKEREFQIEAERLVAAPGSVLRVVVDGKDAGTMTVGVTRSARLNLNTQNRQTVPTIEAGSTVAVIDAAGNTLIFGSF